MYVADMVICLMISLIWCKQWILFVFWTSFLLHQNLHFSFIVQIHYVKWINDVECPPPHPILLRISSPRFPAKTWFQTSGCQTTHLFTRAIVFMHFIFTFLIIGRWFRSRITWGWGMNSDFLFHKHPKKTKE